MASKTRATFTIPCEATVKKLLPSIRAALAIVLVREYDISAYRTAKLLGLTPASVSNYLSGRRGRGNLDSLLGDPELKEMIRDLAELLLKACQPNAPEVQLAACNICRKAREKGII